MRLKTHPRPSVLTPKYHFWTGGPSPNAEVEPSPTFHPLSPSATRPTLLVSDNSHTDVMDIVHCLEYI